MKVTATPSALDLIEELKKNHGKELLFHQSGGCCDGSAPMCYPVKEYQVGQDDIMIGEIGGIPFYISETQHSACKIFFQFHYLMKTFHPFPLHNQLSSLYFSKLSVEFH